MKLSKIILIFIFIIIGLIIYEFVRLNTLTKCPKPYIEYRYVPRSFKEEQDQPVPIENIFNKMFSYPSPWMISRGIGITDKRAPGLKI
jgi:hypothetical protein